MEQRGLFVMVFIRFHNCSHLSVPDESSSHADVLRLPTLITLSLVGLFPWSNSSCWAFSRILSHLSSSLGLFSMTTVTLLPDSTPLKTNTETDTLIWSSTRWHCVVTRRSLAESDDTRGCICTICVVDLLMMSGLRSKHVEEFNFM
jgi:hypothetical protein